MVTNQVYAVDHQTGALGGSFNMVVTGWGAGDRSFRKISEEQSGNDTNSSSSSSSRTGAAAVAQDSRVQAGSMATQA